MNRAPLVVVVGQQDRRHLALEPFLAGRLEGLAGEYPVSFDRPAIMDRLAERQGEDAPWPGFEEVRLATIAEGLGCPARRIAGHGELLAVLDEVAPGLASRDEPLLLDVVVAADPTFGE